LPITIRIAAEVFAIGVPGLDATGVAVGANVGASATGAAGIASHPSSNVASPVYPSGHVHSAPCVPLTQVDPGYKQGELFGRQ
jgi:hypothetical protein